MRTASNATSERRERSASWVDHEAAWLAGVSRGRTQPPMPQPERERGRSNPTACCSWTTAHRPRPLSKAEAEVAVGRRLVAEVEAEVGRRWRRWWRRRRRRRRRWRRRRRRWWGGGGVAGGGAIGVVSPGRVWVTAGRVAVTDGLVTDAPVRVVTALPSPPPQAPSRKPATATTARPGAVRPSLRIARPPSPISSVCKPSPAVTSSRSDDGFLGRADRLKAAGQNHGRDHEAVRDGN